MDFALETAYWIFVSACLLVPLKLIGYAMMIGMNWNEFNKGK